MSDYDYSDDEYYEDEVYYVYRGQRSTQGCICGLEWSCKCVVQILRKCTN